MTRKYAGDGRKPAPFVFRASGLVRSKRKEKSMKDKNRTDYLREARVIKPGVLRGLSPMQSLMANAIDVNKLAEYLRKED